MASCRARTLPSDPDFLLHQLGDESESEDEFDGWLGPEDGPLLVHDDSKAREDHEVNPRTLLRRSRDSGYPRLLTTSPSRSQQQSPSPSSSVHLEAASTSLSPMQEPINSSFSPPAFTANPGVIPNMAGKAPVDFFRLIFDESVVDLITTETSRYARQYMEREREHLETHPHARAHEWRKTELTPKEIEAFLALLIAMGICGFPTLRSYWSKNWPFANNNFSSIVSSRRFELILKFFHLNDSETQPKRGDPGFDKLYKVRPFLDIVLEKFKSCYQPHQHISIDESMISYKGRLSFVQYLPKKPHKWGLKAWVLADSTNGYTWGWKLYTGKEGDITEHGLAHRVVMDLINDQRLERKGYIVFTDNFYSSPALFKALTERGFGGCGTARKDLKGIPCSISTASLQKGEVRSTREDGVMALKWRDKRDVVMLSTYHDDSMVRKSRRCRKAEGGVESIKKPRVVEEYNQFMGGVDKSNQMVLYYGFAHKSVKWWKRVFFHILDLSLVNAHLLYLASGNKRTQLEFRTDVAKSLLEGFERQRHHRTPRAPEIPLRLTEARPFLEPTPQGARPDCRVCSNRRAGERHQTGYQCKGCKTPLCPHPCMERYHTLKDYKIKY